MRIYSAVFCVFLVLSSGGAQEKDDTYSVHLVKGLLQHPRGLSTGFSEKQLNRLGDRISIALLKILDEQDLKNPQEIREILPLIRNAFLAPQIIAIAEDRKPAVTLLLLRYVEANVQDDDLKKEIVQVMGFIKEKTARNR